jgi:hypothetical protein
MNLETIVMCVVALILGMLMANMLKSVCGCKVVEGHACEDSIPDVDTAEESHDRCRRGIAAGETPEGALAPPGWPPGVRLDCDGLRGQCDMTCGWCTHTTLHNHNAGSGSVSDGGQLPIDDPDMGGGT